MRRRSARALAIALAIAAGAASAVGAQRDRPDFHARYIALAAQRGLSDSARLHRLFALDWEYTNVESPESASFVGFPGLDDRWTDNSLAAIARRRRELPDRRIVLRTIDRRRLGPADRLSYDVFSRGVDEAIDGARFPSELLAVTQLEGPQYLMNVLAYMPAGTVREYEHILARLAGIPRVIDETRVLLDSGLSRGVTPPRATLRDVPAQVERLVPEDAMRSALLAPFASFPDSMAAADRARLSAAAIRVYVDRVRPSYLALADYLRHTRLQQTVWVWSRYKVDRMR